MGLVVMKFGGSSVATPEHIKRVADIIIRKYHNHKNRIVVVVSAPGDTTDELIEMAHQITKNPDGREMDMLLATGEQVSIALLAMALKAKKVPAISFTGPQAGIFADSSYTKARITRIVPTRILQALRKNIIVVVAGFQGINPQEEITTLGRGGSDLTAVALAAALKANVCEIYTDVSGVYTTDPRIVPKARKIPEISYDEMLEMAGSGAQVMQARSIEVAKKFGVVIEVKNTFCPEESGTIIKQEVKRMEEVVVSGIAFEKNQAKLSILDVYDRPGIAAKIFGALGKNNINVDMIIQSAARQDRNDISFTVAKSDLARTLRVLRQVKKVVGASDVIYKDNIAKVSVVGVGMRSHPGIAARMFSALARENINIEMIATSEIKISCVIAGKDVQRAVTVLHKEFGLEKEDRQ